MDSEKLITCLWPSSHWIVKKVRVTVLIEILNLHLLFPLLFAIGKGKEGSTRSNCGLQQCGKFKQNVIARCVFSAKRKLCLVSSQVGCHHYKRSGEKEPYTPAQTENRSSQYAYIWKDLQNQLLQWLPSVGVLSKTCWVITSS